MKYYLDGKELSLEQLDKALEEVDKDPDCDEICWRITLCNVHDDKLCFVTEVFEEY